METQRGEVHIVGEGFGILGCHTVEVHSVVDIGCMADWGILDCHIAG
jgi:hypothetical protein